MSKPTSRPDSALGRHLLLDLHGCPAPLLDDIHALEVHLSQAARNAGATVINTTFHRFSPFGVSGVVVIQESHLSIHTWPEHGFAAIDIFTCGPGVNPHLAAAYLQKALRAVRTNIQNIPRGQIAHPPGPRTPIPAAHTRNLWFTEKTDNLALSLRHAGVVYQAQSPFQKIEILDTYGYGRLLALDGRAMCTERDECVYHEMIAHVPALLHPKPGTALVIGGGDGGAARELARHPSLSSIAVVELDAVVIQAARQHLPGLSAGFADPRVQVYIANGRDFVQSAPPQTYDLVLIDAPGVEILQTAAFYRHIHRCLKPQGLLSAQIPALSDPQFVIACQNLRTVFGPARVHPYFAFIPTYATGMVGFLLACKSDIHPLRDLDDTRANAFSRAHALQYHTADIHRASFALPPFIKTLLGDPR